MRVLPDPNGNLNLHETLKNAITPRRREAVRQDALGEHLRHGGRVLRDGVPDESAATSRIVDQSGSMARYGKYYQAKKVA